MKIIIFINHSHNMIGRAYKETESLTRAGHQVTILARYDNKLQTEEIVGGAKVLRYIVWPQTRIPFIKQIIFSLRWIRIGLRLDADVYQASDADTLLEAAVCAVIKRKKLVYDSYELFLDIISLQNKKIVRCYWWLKEWIGVRLSDCVIVANKERAEVMRRRYQFAKKIEVIENFPNKIIIPESIYLENRKVMREKLNISNKTVFVFQGYLNKNRGLEELALALPYCKKLQGTSFLIIGDGDYKSDFEKYVKQKYNNFIFTGRVDYLKLSQYLSAGDVGLVFYPPICLNYIYAASNKLYEYMMNRLSVLSNNIITICRVLMEEKCGLYYGDGAESLAEKIDYLVDNAMEISKMRQNGFVAAMQKYNWEYQEQKFLNIYEKL